MKTIFRYTTFTVLLAAILAVGALAAFAQDPAADPCAGAAAVRVKWDENYLKKDFPSRKIAVEAGKQFIEKYATCTDYKDFVDYLNKYVGPMEIKLKADEKKDYRDGIVKKFKDATTAKNWDEVYANGKILLGESVEDYRLVELVLGSIGLDETAKSPRVTKWNDETLKYAKMSIADIEAGKPFKAWGSGTFTYKDKNDALSWMNYTIGYILTYDKGNKKDGAAYLYKATQLVSDTNTNPVVIEGIGPYYLDELNKLYDEIKALAALQNKDDTAEVAQQKVDAIKAKVALANGTAERVLDTYGRAYKLAQKDTKNKPYADKLYKLIQDVYQRRFEKTVGIDAWINTATSKPMPNPTTPIAPVTDAEPAVTTTTPATTVKPGTPVLPVKPTTAPATKPVTPAAKPATAAKPGATTTKKVVVTKKGTK